jgi:flavin-dependent dehydrogenase
MTGHFPPSTGQAGMGQYDVIIVGGSFAGLSAAAQLKGRRVLLIDQRPIGSHQTSTCAMPLATAEALGVLSSVLEVHHSATIHTGGRHLAYRLNVPYVTFNYEAFCRTLLAQTGAEVLQARATGYHDGTVQTTQGSMSAPFVVDASGWQSLMRDRPSRDMKPLGYGIETELPVRLMLEPGLHFYYEKSIARNGYGWVFPCGATTRIGVCAFDKEQSLGPILDNFLARFGLTRGATHGGPMPFALRQPLSGDLFVVGDAAGQCMPLWAEGIRSAIYFATACGRAIKEALDGSISPEDARNRYAALVTGKAGFHKLMLHLQEIVAAMPEAMRGAILGVVAWPPIACRFMTIYLNASGWLQSDAPLSLPQLRPARGD